MENERIDIPERKKPASNRTTNLPELSSHAELGSFIMENFPKHYKVGWYFISPEELCDIVEKYENVIQAHWKEGPNPPLAEYMVWVKLFDKGKAGTYFELTGLLEFTAEYAGKYCREEGIDLLMWGVKGKHALNFKCKLNAQADNDWYEKYYKHEQIEAIALWGKICKRRAEIENPTQVSQNAPIQLAQGIKWVAPPPGKAKRWWQFWK